MMASFFHYLFVALILAFAAVRIGYLRLAARSRGKTEYREGQVFVGFRTVAAAVLVVSVLGYMLRPDLFSWAEIAVPEWLRWVGAVMGIAGVALLVWVHRALGSNFSTTLHLREKHTLVTNGPYRRVRHPMYTVFYIYFTGVLLLTGNWFIGGVPLLAVTLIVATRLKKEEAAMLEKFGEQYREYMMRSGRFVPPLRT